MLHPADKQEECRDAGFVKQKPVLTPVLHPSHRASGQFEALRIHTEAVISALNPPREQILSV